MRRNRGTDGESRDHSAEHRWQPPRRFDEYELIRPLGRGRGGMVYLADDTLLDRRVAIKFIPSMDDAALARFLVEARAAARLQHPNVATLYRVGQLDGRPFLVSELVRGVSLDRLEKPIDPSEALGIGIDLARGLAAAHRRGVLHRDIKPGNAVLADSGEAKLLDFGLAKLVALEPAGDPNRKEDGETEGLAGPRLSLEDEAALGDISDGSIMGTPYFMSPEAWRGEEPTEQSDIHSLGLLLFELIAGAGPFRGVALRELPAAVRDTDPRPLRSVAPATPEPLASVIDRAIRREPADRFRTADDLLAHLEALRAARRRGPAPVGNPYRGLRPFEPEHRALFFGRQRPLTLALERLRSDPFVLVTGDSGVGKSSLCAAGLLPAIAEGGLEDGRTWAVARIVPGQTPAAVLAAQIAPLIDLDEAACAELLEGDPGELARAVRRGIGESAGLLIYVDQLEELVTVASDAEAELAAQALGAMAVPMPGVRLLATARSDFLSRLEALPGLRDRVSRSLLLLAPLSSDETREAIVGPAAVVGTRFETDELIETLVESAVAAQGATPLLQFALAELWERRDADSGVIRAEALESLGGVEGALSRHADGVVAVLTAGERRAARAVLMRLVTVAHTRARRLESELLSLSPDAGAALAALVRGRLLVAGETPDGTSYEIAHEALVRGWQTLAAWLAEEAENRALIHRVELAAADWRRHNRSRDTLWSARQLAELERVPRDSMTPAEREFIDAGQRGDRRRRWIRRATAATVVLGGLAIWGGVELNARHQVAQDIAADLRRSDAALAEARQLAARLETIEAEAFRSFDEARTEEGERLWAEALALRRRLADAYRDAAAPLERALLLDGTRADVRRHYAELLFERARMADEARRTEERDELLRRMSVYDDGGSLARRWAVPARLDLSTDPPGARVHLHRYRDDGGAYVLEDHGPLGTTPLRAIELAPGSLLLELRTPDGALVRYPLDARRGETLSAKIAVPATDEAPAGFVYVPGGRTRFGSGEEETLRSFFDSVPLHEIWVDDFYMARHEATFAEWIEFLEALEPEERERRTPRVGRVGQTGGSLALRRLGPGSWELQRSTGSLRPGERLRYPERSVRVEHDWLRLPVSGISYEDALAYAAWLDRSQRAPGARLCSEQEWERGARGADARTFPHGNVLSPDDANFDETYGKNPGEAVPRAGAFGADEVGSHPASRSPFGIDDLAGNVWEWVTGPGGLAVARGGSFYYARTTQRIDNRETPEPTYRDLDTGTRLCADRKASVRPVDAPGPRGEH